jgi:hypothetical protein
MMEENENISVDSAKVGTDKTVWTTGKYEIDNNSGQLSRRITVGKNTAQGLAISDPSSGLAVSDLVWRPKIGDYMVDNTPAEFRVLQNRLDEYARLSTNLIFRNAHGWAEPGYWASDRLKELIAQYPDWEITIDNGLNPSVQGSDVFMVAQDPDQKAKYGNYAMLSVALDESVAVTYILDMLVVKWHDREWSFTFEKQDKDSFLKDFERVIKIVTSILDHITKRRKEDENMKKSLDIIAEGAKYK